MLLEVLRFYWMYRSIFNNGCIFKIESSYLKTRHVSLYTRPPFMPPNGALYFLLLLGKIEGKKRRGWQSLKWLDSITNSMNMNLSKIQEIVKFRQAWHAAFHGVTKSQTWLSNWTTATSFPRSLRLPNKLLQAPDWGVFLGAHSMLTCCHPPSADTPNCLWFTVPMGALKMKWSHSVVCDSLQPHRLYPNIDCSLP